MLDFPQFAGSRMKCRRLDVAVADRPGLGLRAGLARERVVRRHGTVGIDPHHLSQMSVQALRLVPAFLDGTLAQSDEEFPVPAEDETRAEVHGGSERRALMEDHLDVLDPWRRAIDETTTRHRRVVEAAPTGFGVAPVDEAVLRMVGVERHVEEAALAARVHRGQAGGGRRQRAIGRQHAQSARSLRHQQATPRKERDRPGMLEPGRELDHLEGDAALLLRRAGLAGEGRLLGGRIGRPGIDALSQGEGRKAQHEEAGHEESARGRGLGIVHVDLNRSLRSPVTLGFRHP